VDLAGKYLKKCINSSNVFELAKISAKFEKECEKFVVELAQSKVKTVEVEKVVEVEKIVEVVKIQVEKEIQVKTKIQVQKEVQYVTKEVKTYMSKHREVQFNRQIDALRYQNRKLEEENEELGCQKSKLEYQNNGFASNTKRLESQNRGFNSHIQELNSKIDADYRQTESLKHQLNVVNTSNGHLGNQLGRERQDFENTKQIVTDNLNFLRCPNCDRCLAIPYCEKTVVGNNSYANYTSIHCPFDDCQGGDELRWYQVDRRRYGDDRHVPSERSNYLDAIFGVFGQNHGYLGVGDDEEEEEEEEDDDEYYEDNYQQSYQTNHRNYRNQGYY